MKPSFLCLALLFMVPASFVSAGEPSDTESVDSANRGKLEAAKKQLHNRLESAKLETQLMRSINTRSTLLSDEQLANMIKNIRKDLVVDPSNLADDQTVAQLADASTPLLWSPKMCKVSIQECVSKLVAELESTGFIGVEFDRNQDLQSTKVSRVIEGSPADKAGIQIGDDLLALEGIQLGNVTAATLSRVKLPGKDVQCAIRRSGKRQMLKLTLTHLPSDLVAKTIGEQLLLYSNRTQRTAAK